MKDTPDKPGSNYPQIEESWKQFLDGEMDSAYFRELWDFIQSEKQQGQVVYPSEKNIFQAFSLTSPDNLKVVILGQDPYHGPGQAHGLAFSVPDGNKFPPSLRNIFKELRDDLGCEPPFSGNLERWGMQGVLLLNTTLTVRHSEPGSHQHKGWERFTDSVIKKISDKKEHIVFLLWGKPAAEKEKLINQGKHLVLKAPHPSPFSAHTGFLGCKHFSKTNAYLLQHGITPVDWNL